MRLGAVRPELARLPFCYLTTTGRLSGQPHRIEIWFAAHPERSTIYILSGGRERSDWVRNLREDPHCTVEIGDATFTGTGRVVADADEDALARTLVFEKYREDDDLEEWRVIALPVAVELVAVRPM